MEQFEELAEEGGAIVEKFWNIVKDIPMNAFVYSVMAFLAGIGWLSRHLTPRAADLAVTPPNEQTQADEVDPSS